MNKLEYHVLKILQDMMLKEVTTPRYIDVEGNLICVKKGTPELDLYLKTELVLEGRRLNMFSFDKVDDCLYKVIWEDKFLYLVGSNTRDKDIKYSKELELLSLSDNPLTNYLKTL